MWRVIAFVVLLADAAPTVVVDYPAAYLGRGWIRIALQASSAVHVDLVRWCKSMVTNAVDPPPPDIDRCMAPNLMHLQLFPSKRPYLRDPPEAEPNTLYIDPDDLGGWDMQRQMLIIINGRNQGDNTLLEQVVRFNPLPQITLIEDTAVAITTNAPSTTLITSQSVTEPAPTTSALDVLPLPAPLVQLTRSHPWLGVSIFLGAGLVVIGLSAALIRWRQLRNQRAQPAAGEVVEFEMVDMSNPGNK